MVSLGPIVFSRISSYKGIPAMLLGVACFFLLPARPEATKYLTEEEREMAIERMNRSSSGDTGAVVNRNHVIMALKDWRVCIAIEAYVHSGLKKYPRSMWEVSSILEQTPHLQASRHSSPPSSKHLGTVSL